MSKEKKYEKWTNVKGLPIRVIGDADRFSMSISADDITIGINGCRIIDGKKGRFISYPAWKDSKGLYHDYSFVIFENREDAEKIVDMF